MSKKNVLVIGATGNQGGAVARALLEAGHDVRAVVRDPSKPAAEALRELGAGLVQADLGDVASLESAASDVDAVFAVTTMVAGLDVEVQHGRNIGDAALAAGVPHLVFSSVADAQNATGIPHFESKWEIERYLSKLAIPTTVTAPAFFFDNVLFPWNVESIKSGLFRHPMPADLKLQMVSLRDIGRFNTLVLGNPGRFIGKRIDYAADEIDGNAIAAALSSAAGHKVSYAVQSMEEMRAMSDDMATMFEWFASTGYSADIARLRADSAEVGWQRFGEWAATQGWSALLA